MDDKPILKWVESTTTYGPSGLTAEEALDWMKVQTTPEIIYPDDCGGPHEWEKYMSNSGCQCSQCEDFLYWMECANCMMRWNTDVMTAETRAIWDAAPWG